MAADRVEMPRLMRKYEPRLAIIGPTQANLNTFREVAERIRACAAEIPVMLVTQNSSEDLALAALRAGLEGYVKYPSIDQELADELVRCLSRRNGIATECICEPGEMIGESRRMQEISEYLARIASTESNILITGETGTGKELAAEFVHRRSRRRNKALVTINCAAIPDSLLESELFGYERGAFTGAHSLREGKLKTADGGTIFLDEIGDMSAYAQAKILRAIDNKEIQRLGGSANTAVNIRIIAATNQELEKLVSEGTFRKDLFFRLNVARVHLPPLRERREDIPAIAHHYLDRLRRDPSSPARCPTPEVLKCLLSYDWPGNIRELKNVLEILCADSSSNEISVQELPLRLWNAANGFSAVSEDERKRLVWALTSTDWNKSKAAEKLNWSRMTLYRKMAKHQVSRKVEAEAV